MFQLGAKDFRGLSKLNPQILGKTPFAASTSDTDAAEELIHQERHPLPQGQQVLRYVVFISYQDEVPQYEKRFGISSFLGILSYVERGDPKSSVVSCCISSASRFSVVRNPSETSVVRGSWTGRS